MSKFHKTTLHYNQTTRDYNRSNLTIRADSIIVNKKLKKDVFADFKMKKQTYNPINEISVCSDMKNKSLYSTKSNRKNTEVQTPRNQNIQSFLEHKYNRDSQIFNKSDKTNDPSHNFSSMMFINRRRDNLNLNQIDEGFNPRCSFTKSFSNSESVMNFQKPAFQGDEGDIKIQNHIKKLDDFGVDKHFDIKIENVFNRVQAKIIKEQSHSQGKNNVIKRAINYMGDKLIDIIPPEYQGFVNSMKDPIMFVKKIFEETKYQNYSFF